MEEFTFSPSQDRFILTIAINDDDTLELRTERFFARAELVSSDATGVMIIPDQSEITILDEDSKLIKIAGFLLIHGFIQDFSKGGGGNHLTPPTYQETVSITDVLTAIENTKVSLNRSIPFLPQHLAVYALKPPLSI